MSIFTWIWRGILIQNLILFLFQKLGYILLFHYRICPDSEMQVFFYGEGRKLGKVTSEKRLIFFYILVRSGF